MFQAVVRVGELSAARKDKAGQLVNHLKEKNRVLEGANAKLHAAESASHATALNVNKLNIALPIVVYHGEVYSIDSRDANLLMIKTENR